MTDSDDQETNVALSTEEDFKRAVDSEGNNVYQSYKEECVINTESTVDKANQQTEQSSQAQKLNIEQNLDVKKENSTDKKMTDTEGNNNIENKQEGCCSKCKIF